MARKRKSEDARRKRLMEVNASTSPFLRLPPELRNKIYELVLGGRLVHIEYEGDTITGGGGIEDRWALGKGLFHNVCCSEMSEEDVYERSKHVEKEEHQDAGVFGTDSYLNPYEYDAYSGDLSCDERHRYCHNTNSIGTERIDTSILLVCRQIYQEARFFPLSTNTFSVREVGHLAYFMKMLLPVQKAAIGGLHFEYLLESGDDWVPWNRFLTVETVKSLKGLRRLHLCIEQRLDCDREYYRDMRSDVYQQDLLRGILNLQRLPLETVTVVMTDDQFGEFEPEYHDWMENELDDKSSTGSLGDGDELRAAFDRLQDEYRWTAVDKRKFCEHLRAQLLKPWIKQSSTG